MSDPAADVSLGEDEDELRLKFGANLTAVRIWPKLSEFVDVNDDMACRRFIAILTRYKVLVSQEASQAKRSVADEVRALLRMVEQNDLGLFIEQFERLRASSVGHSAAVEFGVILRHHSCVPRDQQLKANEFNAAMALAAGEELVRRIESRRRPNGRGRRRRSARERLMKCLTLFFDKYGLGDRPKTDRRTQRQPFVDFLLALNAALWIEVNRSKEPDRNLSMRLPETTLPLSEYSNHKHAREGIQTALRRLHRTKHLSR